MRLDQSKLCCIGNYKLNNILVSEKGSTILLGLQTEAFGQAKGTLHFQFMSVGS